MQQVVIYADGACSGNPGPGGWGAILVSVSPSARKEIAGAHPNTTNNRMELTAVISALHLLKKPCRVTVVTDSQYVVNAFRQRWIENWRRNGWRTSDKKPVKNDDLWRELLACLQPHAVTWEWVRGHAGHPENERADQLAVEAREVLTGGGTRI